MFESEKLDETLVKLLKGGQSYVSLEKVFDDIKLEYLTRRVDKIPYNIWELSEHIRFSQEDILNYCINDSYKERKWPDEYWPKKVDFISKPQWEICVEQIVADRNKMIDWILNNKNELLTPLKNGKQHTLAREAMILAEHTAYHAGQIILIRRLLNIWTQ